MQTLSRLAKVEGLLRDNANGILAERYIDRYDMDGDGVLSQPEFTQMLTDSVLPATQYITPRTTHDLVQSRKTYSSSIGQNLDGPPGTRQRMVQQLSNWTKNL